MSTTTTTTAGGSTREPEFNYYDELGVQTDATETQIRNAFRRVALKFHPDKNPSEEGLEIFSRCAQAYEVLADPVSRSMYDMLVGVRPESAEEMLKINRIKREAAGKAVALMEESVEASRMVEMEKDGLVILDAQYGDVASRGTRNRGGLVNVTVPLQCLVEQSALVLPAGGSKSWLEGFYDPCPGKTKSLLVRYKFLGILHECTVGDDDELCIPMECHAVEGDGKGSPASSSASSSPAKGTIASKRMALRADARKKRRRRWALLSAVAVVVGFFFARKNGTFEGLKTGGFVSPGLMRLLSGKKQPAAAAAAVAASVIEK